MPGPGHCGLTLVPLPGAPREWLPGGLVLEGSYLLLFVSAPGEVSTETSAPHLALLSALVAQTLIRPEPASSCED